MSDTKLSETYQVVEGESSPLLDVARQLGSHTYGATRAEAEAEALAEAGARAPGAPAPPQAAPLINMAEIASTPGQRGCDRRLSRWEARLKLRGHSTLRRVRQCGLPLDSSAGVVVSGPPGERVAGYRGLRACGSVWCCPRCSTVICARRADEVRQALSAWRDSGGTAALLTLTVRHTASDSPDRVWRVVREAWRELTRGRPWRTYCRTARVSHYVKAFEATWSAEHGWHVHLHAILLAECPPESLVEGADLTGEFGGHLRLLGCRQAVVDAWRRAVGRQGFEALEEGQDMRPVTLAVAVDQMAGYISKSSWDAGVNGG